MMKVIIIIIIIIINCAINNESFQFKTFYNRIKYYFSN